MNKSLKTIINTALYGLFLSLAHINVANADAPDFLPVDKAFVLSINQNVKDLSLRWKISSGYKLYKEKIDIKITNGLGDLGEIKWPLAESYFDRNFNEDILIYKESLGIKVPVSNLSKDSVLQVTYQGCAEEGLCYPPVTQAYKIPPGVGGVLSPLSEDKLIPTSYQDKTTTVSEKDDLNLAKELLKSDSLFKIALGFWFFGLLLSFTPCVLPMIPILSSIIVGNQKDISVPTKGFLMAVAYCAGMAIVYTSMGLMAGLLGEGLASYLQQPWVLILFASMLTVFSLSMFDVVAFQMPSVIQERLNQASSRLPGGKFVGVFCMGALSALMVGPCVAGPLAGALIYISQTKDIILGGVALFAMAVGMSVPLLVTGVSAGKLLPKAGPWMMQVKYIFGLLLLAVALWMIMPLISERVALFAWGGLAILTALYLDIFGDKTLAPSFGAKFKKLLAIMIFLIGVAEIWGGISGATNLLQPLGKSPFVEANVSNKLKFERVHSLQELDQVLANKRKVMVDFYADWCVTCKEMENFTFSNSNVQLAAKDITLVQLDVTKNSDEDRAMLRRYGLFGPPAILFFKENGEEISGMRVVGFMDSEKFTNRLFDFKKL